MHDTLIWLTVIVSFARVENESVKNGTRFPERWNSDVVTCPIKSAKPGVKVANLPVAAIVSKSRRPFKISNLLGWDSQPGMNLNIFLPELSQIEDFIRLTCRSGTAEPPDRQRLLSTGPSLPDCIAADWNGASDTFHRLYSFHDVRYFFDQPPISGLPVVPISLHTPGQPLKLPEILHRW